MSYQQTTNYLFDVYYRNFDAVPKINDAVSNGIWKCTTKCEVCKKIVREQYVLCKKEETRFKWCNKCVQWQLKQMELYDLKQKQKKKEEEKKKIEKERRDKLEYHKNHPAKRWFYNKSTHKWSK